jgi:hypothetical protein
VQVINARALPKRDPLMLIVRVIGEHVSEGSAIQKAVARVAQYRPNIPRDITGRCKCSGGDGHCTRCDTLLVFEDMHHMKGDDGMDGQMGRKPVDPLLCGKHGSSGEGLSIVRPQTAGGLEQQYRSVIDLSLWASI